MLFTRSPSFQSVLTKGNYFFTAIFAIESFGKLAAMSPRYFFAVSILNVLLAPFETFHIPGWLEYL